MNSKAIIIFVFFTLAGVLAAYCKTERHAQTKPINLTAIPTVIGSWHMVSQDNRLSGIEKKFLDEVVVRTYESEGHGTMMLAIAYGADQRKKFTLHLPELCYSSAGYKVNRLEPVRMSSPPIIMDRMIGVRPDGGAEAVQYWILLDGTLVNSDFHRKLILGIHNIFGSEAGGSW